MVNMDIFLTDLRIFWSHFTVTSVYALFNRGGGSRTVYKIHKKSDVFQDGIPKGSVPKKMGNSLVFLPKREGGGGSQRSKGLQKVFFFLQ